MTGRWTKIAVLIPVLGLSVLVGRAEYAVRHGSSWTIPIDGYDPRDLLQGQYLRYQYRFNWDQHHTCGSDPFDETSSFAEVPEPRPVDGCCLCLSRVDPSGINPLVQQIDCAEARGCDGVLLSSSVVPPLRYFIPEAAAAELETSLRQGRDAALELNIGPGRTPAVRELVLEGRPWRDALRL